MSAILNEGWRNFMIWGASQLRLQEMYREQTGELARYPDQTAPSANDNTSVTGSRSPREAALRFAYWLTLTHWGAGPGPTAEFMAAARAAFPEFARRMDEGWDKRLESVK